MPTTTGTENGLLATEEPYEPPEVVLIDGRWYWLDETSDLNGPYGTREEAQAALDEYVIWL